MKYFTHCGYEVIVCYMEERDMPSGQCRSPTPSYRASLWLWRCSMKRHQTQQLHRPTRLWHADEVRVGRRVSTRQKQATCHAICAGLEHRQTPI